MDLGPRAGDIVASVEDLVFAAASAMVFLGPQAPPMPPPAPDLDDPLDPLSAGGGGWGTEEAMAATAAGGAMAAGGVRKDSEHYRGENFNAGLSSPPLASPIALLGSADGFAAPGAAEGRQDSGHGHGQLGGPVEIRRGNSRSPPVDMVLSSGSPTSRSPVGGGRGGDGGGPSVFGEVRSRTVR